MPQNTETRITHILYHLRDKREYYLGIINYDDGTLFLGFFRDYMLQNVSIKMSGSYRRILTKSAGGLLNQQPH